MNYVLEKENYIEQELVLFQICTTYILNQVNIRDISMNIKKDTEEKYKRYEIVCDERGGGKNLIFLKMKYTLKLKYL
jgi:hypothetical protein